MHTPTSWTTQRNLLSINSFCIRLNKSLTKEKERQPINYLLKPTICTEYTGSESRTGATTTMYPSCSSHALVWSSAAGFPSFSRMYKEGGRAGRSRSVMMGAGQVNRMSCICKVWSSARKSRLMVNTSPKSRRRGAASVSQLTCAQQPAVSTYKYSTVHKTDCQYIMELLFF